MINFADFSKHWKWCLAWGVILLGLGIAALSVAAFTTLVSVLFLGFLFAAVGIVMIFNTCKIWWGTWHVFTPNIIMAGLYLVLGVLFIVNPVMASLSITLLLAWIFIFIGALRIFYAVKFKLPRWQWILFNGIVTLALGCLILAEWPASSLFIIGIFVGVDLLLCGWALIMGALLARETPT